MTPNTLSLKEEMEDFQPTKLYLIIGFNMSSVNHSLTLSGAKSSTVLDSTFSCAYTNEQAE